MRGFQDIICNFAFLLSICCFQKAQGSSESELLRLQYFGIITELQEHLKSPCINLHVRSSQPMQLLETKLMLEMEKSIIMQRKCIFFKKVANAEDENESLFECRNSLNIFPILLSGEGSRLLNFEILRRTTLTEPVWLLFLNSSTSLYEFFDGVDIPFDCEFLVAQSDQEVVTLTEVYRVREDLPLQMFHFGVWRPNVGLEVTELAFHERRNSLLGTTLKVVVINDPPDIYLKKKDNEYQVHGYMWRAVKELSQYINFTIDLSVHKHWGKPSANGSWYGVVWLLATGQVDLCANAFILTSQRKEVVDNTIPLQITRYGVFIKAPSKTSFKWTQYFAPFSWGLWLMTTSSMLAIGWYIRLLHNIEQRYQTDEQSRDENNCYTGPSVFTIIGIFLQQGQDVVPRSASCRVVFLTALLTSYILLAAYSGVLISFITTNKVELPFRDVKGLIRDSSYKVGVYGVPMDYRTTDNTSALKEDLDLLAWKIKMNDGKEPVTSLMKGFKRVCNSKFAFVISFDAARKHKHRIECAIVDLPGISFYGTSTLGLMKNSTYRTLFDHVFLKLRNSGSLNRRNIHVEKQKDDIKAVDLEVEIDDVTPILVFLLVWMLLATSILVMEHMTFIRHQRRRHLVHENMKWCHNEHLLHIGALKDAGIEQHQGRR